MRVMPSFRARRPVRIPRSSELDLDVDAGGEVELHQGVDGLRRRIDDIEHALMRADLELLARLLVDMWRAQHGEFLDLGRQWDRAAHPRAGPLGGVDDLAGRLIEHPVIVGAQADANILVVYGHQRLPVSERALSPPPYLMILATTPAPTVRPPSRMAKRSPSSIAIGAINSISIEMLSPGITISVPSGRCTVPVTSVVRK